MLMVMSPFFHWKTWYIIIIYYYDNSSIKQPFSMAFLNNQRVTLVVGVDDIGIIGPSP